MATALLICEPYSAIALARLRTSGDIVVHTLTSPQDLVHYDLSHIDAILTRSRTVMDAPLLKRASRLQFIGTATAGFDHIDWRACCERHITVTYAPHANVASTAELTIALMLSLLRNIPRAHQQVLRGAWRDGLPRGALLAQQTVGLIGLGRIGSRVAQLLQAFGAHLVAHDPYVEPARFASLHVESVGLIECLRQADLLSLHVPLTQETKHLINRPTLEELSPHALLINTCRGSVVDNLELALALERGQLAGAALDVLEKEPLPKDQRLAQSSKVLFSPHIGAYTEAAFDAASQEIVEKFLAWKNLHPISDTLPLNSPWFEKSILPDASSPLS